MDWRKSTGVAGQRQVLLLALLLVVVLTGCAILSLPGLTPTPGQDATPSPTISTTAYPSLAPTSTPNPNLPVWQNFAGPALTPVTPIPPPLTGLEIPNELKAFVLLGETAGDPYVGSTTAMLLVLYHPRFGRASLFSIPADMFAYIPGYTMQRIQNTFAQGGFDMLADTLAYNLGVRPNAYALIHAGHFTNFVDAEGGLQITVLDPVPDQCGGIPAGEVQMNGATALCYASFRVDNDEIDRNQRQQQLVYMLFLRMLQGGALVDLPKFYQTYNGDSNSSFSLKDLVNDIPLALRIADPGRLGFFTLDQADLVRWKVPGAGQSEAFLVRQGGIQQVMQAAIDFIMQPGPSTDRVQTLVFELTTSPTATLSPTVTLTSTSTWTFTPTLTRHPTITLKPSRTLRPSITFTRTITRTPTITQTRTITITPTNTRRPTVTRTRTPTR